MGVNVIKNWQKIMVVTILLAIISVSVAVIIKNASILSNKKTILIKAMIKYQDSRWDHSEIYEIVSSGDVDNIKVSSILDEESVEDINSVTDSIIKRFEDSIKGIDEKEKDLLAEERAISKIKRSISDELDEEHRKIVKSIVKKASSFTGLEKDLLDLYIDFYSSKIILANNTKDLATKKISVAEYNGFEKKRKDFLKTVASEEKRITGQMRELELDIDDNTYRLLLLLEN